MSLSIRTFVLFFSIFTFCKILQIVHMFIFLRWRRIERSLIWDFIASFCGIMTCWMFIDIIYMFVNVLLGDSCCSWDFVYHLWEPIVLINYFIMYVCHFCLLLMLYIILDFRVACPDSQTRSPSTSHGTRTIYNNIKYKGIIHFNFPHPDIYFYWFMLLSLFFVNLTLFIFSAVRLFYKVHTECTTQFHLWPTKSKTLCTQGC